MITDGLVAFRCKDIIKHHEVMAYQEYNNVTRLELK